MAKWPLLEMGRNSAMPWISPSRKEEKNDISIDLLSKMIVNSIKLSEYYNSYIFYLTDFLL